MARARILVIDDDEKARRLMQITLASKDYAVIMAEDGQEGVELAIQEGPDLIILDVMMPGMDGFETCERLKGDERTKGIPVIMLTATYDLELTKKAFGRGVAMCLTKPYRGEALVNAIEATLAAKRRLARERG
ncbi:MAG: response regulator [candidate division NC10 bacterium]|nr:response regulator [candidate division NC10 bacterium]